MRIYRRRFLVAASALAALPSAVIAQASLPRVAFVGLSGEGGDELEQFKRGMRELGYVDGSNLRLEVPNLGGLYEGLPALLLELLESRSRQVRLRSVAFAVLFNPESKGSVADDPVAHGPRGRVADVREGSNHGGRMLDSTLGVAPTVRSVFGLFRELAQRYCGGQLHTRS